MSIFDMILSTFGFLFLASLSFFMAAIGFPLESVLMQGLLITATFADFALIIIDGDY